MLPFPLEGLPVTMIFKGGPSYPFTRIIQQIQRHRIKSSSNENRNGKQRASILGGRGGVMKADSKHEYGLSCKYHTKSYQVLHVRMYYITAVSTSQPSLNFWVLDAGPQNAVQ